MRLTGIGLRPGLASGTVSISGETANGGSDIVLVQRDPPEGEPIGISGYIVPDLRLPVLPVDTGAPVVGALDSDLFHPGEGVAIDGTIGTADLPTVAATEVVTAFLQRPDRRILLLKRSQSVGSFRGSWAAVSGFLEDPTPLGQAMREIQEETGIPPSEIHLRASAPPVYARDGPRIFVVHPFRFEVRPIEIRLDWEHTEAEWVLPEEIPRRSTVPKLYRAWAAVAPSV